MKVIVTKLDNGDNGFGARGRVDFYQDKELLHSEYFEGKITDTEFTRLVDFRFPQGVDITAYFIQVEGVFEGRVAG